MSPGRQSGAPPLPDKENATLTKKAWGRRRAKKSCPELNPHCSFDFGGRSHSLWVQNQYYVYIHDPLMEVLGLNQGKPRPHSKEKCRRTAFCSAFHVRKQASSP